ncbi:uncharacterized protein LOC127751391 isoform X2 [Frankliniella occidentalis]|uniref:Uncharacterized protein LOC127751391 isoform X2 n=1 Tax=Frankliniella occidentalis TaxID=133901 RepID=A0A9C6X845_FRAOC|nr:uncharacterized protein LOC127751391 isoform X2 [Frankliniella occidentalis]
MKYTVLLGNIHLEVKGSGPGTSLEELLRKFRREAEESIKKLNPTSVPYSEGFYGHVSIPCELLDAEDVKSCRDILQQPSMYAVSNDNCCIAALNKSGTGGLLSHYFDDKFKAQASNPPQFKSNLAMGSASSASKAKNFTKFKSRLNSCQSPQEKAKEAAKVLVPVRKNFSLCACWMCVYSDEVVKEDDHDEMSQETANYYQGKGFFYASGLNVQKNKRNMVSSNFSLSFLNKITPTCLLEGNLPGITTPYLYFGFSHSFFPIHIEDLSLYSLNFLHHGYPKVWVVVPPASISKLHYFLSKEFMCPGHSSCMGLLGHKYHIPTPAWLHSKGIPFKVVQQRSHQAVLVAPNAAHFGFNLGPNVAEAVNFATTKWVPYGIVYPRCTCMPGQVHSDLSTIIRTLAHDMMEAYLQQKIPNVPSDPNFLKCIVRSHLWKESYTNEDSPLCNGPSEESCDAVEAKVYSQPERKLKKCAKRKVIKCPVCDTVYQGGQKQRLLEHINSAHKNLPEKDSVRVNKVLEVMFPQWGEKLPKKICPLCGKGVARSMKAHQTSTGCQPKATGSCV